MSPALEGGFFITRPPGKSQLYEIDVNTWELRTCGMSDALKLKPETSICLEGGSLGSRCWGGPEGAPGGGGLLQTPSDQTECCFPYGMSTLGKSSGFLESL